MDTVLLFAFFIVYGLNLFFLVKNIKHGFFITKLLLTPTLFLFYLYKNETTMPIVFFALLFCFFGDLFMEFSERKICFLAGLSSFLMGHIFYIICFYQQINKAAPWWLFLFLFAYIGYGIYFYRALNIKDKNLRVAVVFYCVVIFMMSFLAMLRVQSVSSISFLLVFSGSLFFIASDSILAYNMFSKKIKHAGIWIMSTYGIAQLLIIAGL